MATEKIFANGLNFREPSENAPEYVIGRIWVKVDDFKAFLDEHNTNSGGVNIDVKRSSKGNIYCELNTWKPEKPNLAPKEEPTIEYPEEDEDSSVPF